jgi:hypothetical protein
MWIRPPHALALCRQSNTTGSFDMHGTVRLCGRLGQNADEIDDGIRSGDRTAKICVFQYVCLDNLGRIGRLSCHLNAGGMTRGQAHRQATLKKQGHEMAADETGSAEHRYGAGRDSSSA